MELSISWPVRLDGKCGLKLVACGRIAGCEGTSVALRIEKYEFRTTGRSLIAPTPGGDGTQDCSCPYSPHFGNMCFWILPSAVRGSFSTLMNARGILKDARLSRQRASRMAASNGRRGTT